MASSFVASSLAVSRFWVVKIRITDSRRGREGLLSDDCFAIGVRDVSRDASGSRSMNGGAFGKDKGDWAWRPQRTDQRSWSGGSEHVRSGELEEQYGRIVIRDGDEIKACLVAQQKERCWALSFSHNKRDLGTMFAEIRGSPASSVVDQDFRLVVATTYPQITAELL
jgi:hypothetical protein